MNQPLPTAPQFAVIIPACNEEPVLARVLDEMLRVLDRERFIIAVGVNGSSDATAAIAAEYPVVVGETAIRGYGHGCLAAIDIVERLFPPVRGYLFCAADGASDPADIARLVAAFETGADFVLGARTAVAANWPVMGLSHVAANYALALWCGLLARRYFSDLAPLRLISRDLLHQLALKELTFGWTIEAQIAAARRGAVIREIHARERERLGGEQKVSGVSWRRTAAIGWKIAVAGWQTRQRLTRRAASTNTDVLVPQRPRIV